jgi:uncharacterized protein YceH (UPF0502 family)
MRVQLDRTEQRIVGVLVEKELSVPEIYPLSLNALVAGCNQKSNRDPCTEYEEFEIQGAITSLCLKEWVARRDGSRATKFAHQLEARLGIDTPQKVILAELLVRGPQTPMELKTRVARMGLHRDAAALTDLLEAMSQHPGGALVELLPRRPRERDARWRHLLGPGTAEPAEAAEPEHATRVVPIATHASTPADGSGRLDALEARIADLERRLDQISGC